MGKSWPATAELVSSDAYIGTYTFLATRIILREFGADDFTLKPLSDLPDLRSRNQASEMTTNKLNTDRTTITV